MTCTQCGTEIADKALICYRCGRATAGVAVEGPGGRTSAGRPLWPALAGLVVLVLAGLFMASAAAGQVPRWLSWVVAGLAAVVLVYRIARRRKG